MSKNRNNRNNRNSDSTFYGIRTVQIEDSDFCTADTSLRLWKDRIPFKKGDAFPDKQQKENAIINKTFDYLTSGKLAEVLSEYIEDLSAMDPTNDIPTAHIVSNLNSFGILVKHWQLILSRCFDSLKVRGVEEKELFEVKFKPIIRELITNMFTCCDRLTIAIKTDNKHILKMYNDKNIVLFRTKDDERVVTLTNLVINDEGQAEELECTSYLPDGSVQYDLFKMEGNNIGELLEHKEQVVNTAGTFAKNGSMVNNSQSYGLPELVNSVSPILSLIRAFSSFTTLIEYSKEMTRVVPAQAKDTDDVWDMTTYYKGGTVTPPTDNDGKYPAAESLVAYKQPNVDWPGIISAIEEANKLICTFSGLSGVLLGTQTFSGSDSGKAILLSCIPTISLANGYIDVLIEEVKQIVYKYLHLADTELTLEDIELVMNSPKNVISAAVNIDKNIEAEKQQLIDDKQTVAEEDANSFKEEAAGEVESSDLALTDTTVE